jgi:hypothetical protein
MRDTKNQTLKVMEIARALWFSYTESNVPIDKLFGYQSQNVIDEGLMIAAEWRDIEAIETFYTIGANVHYVDKAGFSVLEVVLQGHDGYWREYVESAEKAVRFLASAGVTRKDITHDWIIVDCCQTFIAKSEYLKEFLTVTNVAFIVARVIRKDGEIIINCPGDREFSTRRDAEDYYKQVKGDDVFVVELCKPFNS